MPFSKQELKDLAIEFDGMRGAVSGSTFEDAISICEYCSHRKGIELTIEEGDQVRGFMDELEDAAEQNS